MEASAHMAEDTKKPSRTVPLAMFWSVVATYLMGWVSICVLLAVRFFFHFAKLKRRSRADSPRSSRR
jgi:amino acid transporter